MMDPQDLAATREHMAHYWQVALKTPAGAQTDYDGILEALQERVLQLLRDNPRKLMTALYILDIPESRYTAAMDQPTMDDRAWELARAILERESEKIITRRRYAGHVPPPLPSPSEPGEPPARGHRP